MADVQSPLMSLKIPKVEPKGRDIGFAIGIIGFAAQFLNLMGLSGALLV